jgi:hypothetical protein
VDDIAAAAVGIRKPVPLSDSHGRRRIEYGIFKSTH